MIGFVALREDQTSLILRIGTPCGLLLCLWLAWLARSPDTIAGCGPGDCAEVWGSRWAFVFWVPVSWLGAAWYFLWFLDELFRKGRLRAWFAPLTAGAVLWFIIAQLFILESVCPWCMASHVLGLSLFGITLLGAEGMRVWILRALECALILGGIQYLGPGPAMHLVVDHKSPVVKPAPMILEESPVQGLEAALPVHLALPWIGASDAEHVLVEFFDYRCVECRRMAGYMDRFLEAYPGKVKLILVPVPMDGECHANLRRGETKPGSCEITRVALAAWLRDPAGFPRFHKRLMEEPTVTAAHRLFQEKWGDALTEALKDPRLDEQIRSNIIKWRVIAAQSRRLPILRISNTKTLVGVPRSREAFLRTISRELGME